MIRSQSGRAASERFRCRLGGRWGATWDIPRVVFEYGQWRGREWAELASRRGRSVGPLEGRTVAALEWVAVPLQGPATWCSPVERAWNRAVGTRLTQRHFIIFHGFPLFQVCKFAFPLGSPDLCLSAMWRCALLPSGGIFLGWIFCACTRSENYSPVKV